MEFLLQMFAEFLGSPSVENESEILPEQEVKDEKESTEAVLMQNESIEEEPVIFGLMQFH
ncbi:hypothetical protein [Marinilabilia rubra]|uniref:Uncharacterized protein n=1 Tax=Marinilabilia rubra TaxID=2162893 RepID=A0A2U2B6X2_9BACT|nr:hypothetical protein [Marinilabilia rubra]PWD98820.1 hypothetical protein DDZ16_13870 [Marinilabilia rubra]